MTKTDPAWYAFRNAVGTHDFVRAAELLDGDPSLLCSVNRLGETVLHHLAVENDIAGVAWLHAAGADLNTFNAFGIPALFEVALLEYRDLYRWFVEHGANEHGLNTMEQSVIEYLVEHEKHEMAAWVARAESPTLHRVE